MTKEKLVLAFDQADLHRWERQFEMDAPSAKDKLEATNAPHAVSFRGQDSVYGLAVRIKLANGEEADIFFNPVIARALALEVMNAGVSAGWMRDITTITPPWIPVDRKRKV